jgi:penicillin-binding protein 2
MALADFKDASQELHRFHGRLAVAGAVIFVCFGLLFARFSWLQVVQHKYYQTKAEDNRISVVPVAPNRGLILDRNGVVLARNYSAYTLEIFPQRVAGLEATINALAEVIDIQPKDRQRFRKLRQELKGAESIPIKTRLSDEEVARFSANAFRFPGVEIKARLYRQYPMGEVASHVIGYIGRINDADLARLEDDGELKNYKGTDSIGKTGIEASYERDLHGVTGSAQVEIDAGGRGVRTLASTAPVPGRNLTLTLDIRLQAVAEQAFGNFRGALVAIDPTTGGVLALVSRPGYDPNLFVDGIDPASWEALNTDPAKPLNNRALTGAYPPGSTIKPFYALMALELGKRTPEYTINDPGYFTLPGVSRPFRDWKVGGHGAVNLHKSIVVSCDTYYYGIAQDTDIDAMAGFMSGFGFGSPTGLDIKGESKGVLPSRAWKKARFSKPETQRWYVGDSISVGIGQGYSLATPLQLASATAILANDGVAFKPHIVKHVEDTATGELRVIEAEPARTLKLSARNVELIKAAMVDVTRPGGTSAKAFAGAEYSSGGKTGTAQVIGMKAGEKYDASKIEERFRDHALYIAFAPADKPTIALGILVENGGGGGSTAAPIARTVFDYFLLGKVPANMPSLDPDAAEGD